MAAVRGVPARPGGRAAVLAVVAAVLCAACTSGAAQQPAARDGRSGLQASGTIEGRQVAVSAGLPQLLVGDCDPTDGLDDDVCFITDTIGGGTLVVNIENPAVLEAPEEGTEAASENGTGPGQERTLPVADPPCGTPADCDAIVDVAIMTVKLGTDPPIRATGGQLRIERLVPFQNYRGSFSLELPDGRFSGTFDVVPRPG